MAVKNAVNAIELQFFPSSSVTGSYQVINADGTEKSCYLLRITNASTKDVYISFDGITDNEYVRSGATLDSITFPNANSIAWVPLWSVGQKVYVKGLESGTGAIFLSGYYVER